MVPGDFILAKGKGTTEEKEAALKKKLRKTLTPTMQLEITGKCLCKPTEMSIADNFIVHNNLLIAVEKDATIIIAEIMEQLTSEELKKLQDDLTGEMATLRVKKKIQNPQGISMLAMEEGSILFHDFMLIKYDGKIITFEIA